MARYLGWLANSFCFALCCLFAANTVNAVIGSALGVASDGGAAPTETAPADGAELGRSAGDLGVAISSTPRCWPPPAAPTIEEDLEATRLPLTLLGTVSALEPENAWAAIEERDTHATRIVRVNDEIRPGVTVLRIERRRVVLMENGSPRELALAEDEVTAGSPDRRSGRRAAVRPRRARSRGRQRPPGAPRGPPASDPGSPSASPDNIRNPATLFSQARILPKYENGQMVGVQVNAIKPGSLFEAIGIKNGGVIKELNGIKIDSPEQSAKILLEFVDAKRSRRGRRAVRDRRTSATRPELKPTSARRMRAKRARRVRGCFADSDRSPPWRSARGCSRARPSPRRRPAAWPRLPAGVKPVDSDLYALDFNDVELAVVIDTIAKLTNKNFIYDDRVRGRVTIVSPTPMPDRAGLRRVRIGAPGEGLHHGREPRRRDQGDPGARGQGIEHRDGAQLAAAARPRPLRHAPDPAALHRRRVDRQHAEAARLEGRVDGGLRRRPTP